MMRMAWPRRLSKCWGKSPFSRRVLVRMVRESVKFAFQSAVALVVIAASVGASGADLAILRNGNSIRHERRQVVGQVTRLYLSDTVSGYIEIPTNQIERFERDTAPAPALAKSQLPASQTAPPQLATAPAVKPQTAAISQLNPVSLDKV